MLLFIKRHLNKFKDVFAMNELTDKSKKYNVPALEKALLIIETLSTEPEAVGVSELCKRLHIPKTSAFFILNTLDQHEYIMKSEDGKYKLGNKFINIGLNILSKLDIRQIAKPYMDELLKETNFTVHLAVLDNCEAMYVEKVENQAFVKFSTYIGQRQPLHASGVGKALACMLPEDRLDEIVSKVGLPAKTENTITSVKDFKIKLADSKSQGYAIEDEEGEYGIRCIGAPIMSHTGSVVAAIGITALRSDLPIENIPLLGVKLRDTARKISAQMGYTPVPSSN